MNTMLLSLSMCALGAAVAAPLAEDWPAGYSGDDAHGARVLGYWRFEAGAVTGDSSSRAHDLSLAGAVAAEGKMGGGLESFAGWPVADRRHAAIVASKPALSPKGAFTAEMWVKPKPALTADLSPVLLDKKYAGHTDYQWRLSTAEKGGARRMTVSLGFGEDAETFASEAFALGEEWQHVAFTYDGAGVVRFFRNGAPLGVVRKPGRGAVAPGRHPLSIGDRVGSYYAGFAGFIDEVRLCEGALEFRPLAVEFRSERKVWRRMEKAEPMRVVVRNLSKAASRAITLSVSVEGRGVRTFAVAPIAAGAEHAAEYPFDTSLRPEAYRVTARIAAAGEPPWSSEESTRVVIVPRPLETMPVLMWGIYGTQNVHREMARLKELGFTHGIGGLTADHAAVWAAKKPVAPSDDRAAETRAMLDLALENEFGIALPLSPGGWLKERAELQRVDRTGKPYASRPDVNAALPGLAEFCEHVGASAAQAYRDFPAWQAALVNTETRDSSQVSFSEADRAAYRKYSGEEIPAEVTQKSGVDWKKLAGFPADRVIPDDHPLLRYYRWFWTVGDGWNALHTAVHRGVHSTGRGDVWTWFDPAIRAPSLGGSGGAVDVLGQWTYTTPDPLRVGAFTDELLAMARHSPQRPRVMKMTQLFWYRSQSAPKREGAAHIASPFDDHDPDAAYLTIAPMHLRAAFWSKLARPVSGLMYHGWQALVPTDGTGSYRHTHPDTQEEFRRLHREVLVPLGPALLHMGDPRAEVAYLASFTSQMFARRGSYGYSNDEAYLTLLHAQLQPRVIHEEELLAPGGLDDFKVLVLADCDVLTASVAQRLRDFQKRGGLLIGDANLAPAIAPDIRLERVIRTKHAAEDKAAILAAAARLRAGLDARYTRMLECSNPEIVPRLRTAGASDCVFVVNDHREPGTYVGQHGLVMENGLPSSGTLTLRRARGQVYDLQSSREIPATARDGTLSWPVHLGPCDGRAFLITPEPIAALTIAAPESASRGHTFPITVTIADSAARPIAATLPLHVAITDPAGRAAEFTGHHAAKGGRLELRCTLAPNDAPGVWQLRARELASGREATAFLRVAP